MLAVRTGSPDTRVGTMSHLFRELAPVEARCRSPGPQPGRTVGASWSILGRMSVRVPGHDVELRARVNTVRLSPALRIVGEYLIEHAREVAVASSSQLAEQAGVSQASVSRFSQAVGFRDYGGLQHWVRDLVLRDTAGKAGAAAVSNRFQDLADSETAAVAALGEWFGDHALLQRAAGARARRTRCRSSAPAWPSRSRPTSPTWPVASVRTFA